MSKALICDRCKKPFAEQSALHVETKCQFIISHYDFCPKCNKAFKDEFLRIGNKEDNHDE